MGRHNRRVQGVLAQEDDSGRCRLRKSVELFITRWGLHLHIELNSRKKEKKEKKKKDGLLFASLIGFLELLVYRLGLLFTLFCCL